MQGLIFSTAASTAAIVIILLLRKFFKDKVFSKIFVLLWALVIIRLLLPFEFSSALSIYPSEMQSYASMPENNVLIQWDTLSEYDKNAPMTETKATETAEKARVEVSSGEILFYLWLFGSVSFGGYFFIRHFRLVRRIQKSCIPLDAPEKTDDFCLLKSKSILSPFSYGVFRPKVVIPEDISEEQLPFVLLHEHTHIRNRDAALKTAAVFALSLHWFNPFVWILVKYLDRDIERYCDERVLSEIGNEKAAGYANAILDFAEKESIFASLSFFSAASLEERVTSIMKNNAKRSHLPAVIAVFATTLLIMTACGTAPKAEEKNEPVSAGELSSGNDSVSNIIGDIAENSGDEAVIDTNTGELSYHHSENHHSEDACVSSGEISEGQLGEIKTELAEKIDKELQNAIEFVWPCESSSLVSLMGSYRSHTGVDIGLGNGLDIYAAADGTVTTADWGNKGYGHYVVIDHGNGVKSLYAHCHDIFVEVGEEVVAGQIIATTGSTGNSTGPHLHFEIIINEENVDPLEFIWQ